MNKRLIAKTQYLNPTLPEGAAGFAKALAIEPENEDVRLKRGTIYSIFSIKGNSDYDTDLLGKVVHDILHNSYFQSDNISPIQSLEKAISDVKDKISHFTNETISNDEAPPEFSIIAGVLWGNVMYVVQYGEAQGYLVREGEIKPINTISEGGFSAASGVVRDGDVMILCSAEFGKKYPPTKLLSMAIGEEQLLPEETCILLKFNVDATFSPNEQVDFGLPEETYKKERRSMWTSLSTAVSKMKTKRNSKKLPVNAVMPPAIPVKNEVVSSIGDSPITNNNQAPSKTQGMRLRPSNSLGKVAKKSGLITLAIALMLGASIFLTLRNRGTTTPVVPNTVAEQPTTVKPAVEGAEKVAEEPDEEVFYDIKIADQTANPNSLAVFNNSIVVSDVAGGKIFVSAQDVAKFEAETGTFNGIKNLINIKNKLGFVDSEGYKVYDLANEKIVESYKQSGLTVTSAYLDFVYSLEGTELKRYAKDEDVLTASTWAQSEEFANVQSITVAFSIYMVTSDGKLLKYTAGKKDDFTPTGITLTKPVQVLTDIEFDNIYVADAGSQSVFAVDEDGKLIKEYKPKKAGAWNDIRAIGISPDEKTMYVLNGSKVYKVAL